MLLRRAHGISVQFSGDLPPDLEPAAYGLLLQVAQQAGTRAKDLAAHLGVGKATVARQLTRLERLDLITRSGDASDHRAQVVALTAAGWAAVDRVRAARRAHLHDLLSGWSDSDVEVLAQLLGRFNQVFIGRTSAGSADVLEVGD